SAITRMNAPVSAVGTTLAPGAFVHRLAICGAVNETKATGPATLTAAVANAVATTIDHVRVGAARAPSASATSSPISTSRNRCPNVMASGISTAMAIEIVATCVQDRADSEPAI